jgi:hypothetical protein
MHAALVFAAAQSAVETVQAMLADEPDLAGTEALETF